MQVVVNMSDMKVSNNPRDVLVTFSLGSCLAIALYDPGIQAGGLVHCMLPVSDIDVYRAASNPCMFVNTGMTALLEAMEKLGARRERLTVRVSGGAHLLGGYSAYRIGDRNREALDVSLNRLGLRLLAEDTGGTVARSMELHIETGKVFVTAGGSRNELL